MTLTDKCLAVATATLLIYGMVFVGAFSHSGAGESHPDLIYRQAQDDITQHNDAHS